MRRLGPVSGNSPATRNAGGPQAPAGHAEKTGEQYDVGEVMQKNYVGCEPAYARQFQKEY